MSAPEKSGTSGRRAAFLQRMGRMPGPVKENGKATPLLKALRDWGASSKADAVAKGKRISVINENKKNA
jgi:hypothetical protein